MGSGAYGLGFEPLGFTGLVSRTQALRSESCIAKKDTKNPPQDRTESLPNRIWTKCHGFSGLGSSGVCTQTHKAPTNLPWVLVKGFYVSCHNGDL